jgi:hypothetical protein
MPDYLKEIEFATRSLIPIIWGERDRLRKLEAEVAALTKRVADNYDRAHFVAMNAEDADDVGLATGMYWENYFGDDKDRFYKDKERVSLADRVALHQFSAGSLAASLLQHAKQGISLTHGGLAGCPDGRQVTVSQTLKNVIWQGRNQGMHWEEGKPHPPVVQCFDALAKEVAPTFADYRKCNLALDVVELLGWTDFDRFRTDMMLLA